MKRGLVTALIVLAFSLGINAQTIIKLNEKGAHATFTPDGKNIVFSTSNYKGLKVLNLESSKVDVLSDEKRAGYNVIVLNDRVLFKAGNIKNKVNEVSFTTKELKVYDNLYAASLLYSTSKLSKQADNFPVSAKSSGDLYSIELIYSDGLVNQISTKKGENKVWVSLSPDRTKVLYSVVGGKTYIVDLKGNTVASINKAESPKWSDNNTVVYMLTKDNHDYITQGDVYVFNIKSNITQSLTDMFDDIALYPAMSVDGSRIVFNSDKGELYLINLSK